MLIGYARVSRSEQNLDLQKDALHAAGCEKIYTDQISGALSDRPGLKNALDVIRPGDTIVVWRLDRLGRSLKNLIELVNELEKTGVGFKSLHETIDTTSPSGLLIFQIFGALAEFERNIIRERTLAGLAAARSRGKVGGRRKKLDLRQRDLAVSLYREKRHSVREICDMLKISVPTLYSYLGEERRGYKVGITEQSIIDYKQKLHMTLGEGHEKT